ncbi:hypothetical protein ACFL1G_10505 [Planctomycetota bacterium]
MSLLLAYAAKEKLADSFDYTVLMVPRPEFVAASVKKSADGGIINIFAGHSNERKLSLNKGL